MDCQSRIVRLVLLGAAVLSYSICVIHVTRSQWSAALALSALSVLVINVWMITCVCSMLSACRRNKALRETLFDVVLGQAEGRSRRVAGTMIAALWVAPSIFILGTGFLAFGEGQRAAGAGLLLCLLSILILNIGFGYSFLILTYKSERVSKVGGQKENNPADSPEFHGDDAGRT